MASGFGQGIAKAGEDLMSLLFQLKMNRENQRIRSASQAQQQQMEFMGRVLPSLLDPNASPDQKWLAYQLITAYGPKDKDGNPIIPLGNMTLEGMQHQQKVAGLRQEAFNIRKLLAEHGHQMDDSTRVMFNARLNEIEKYYPGIGGGGAGKAYGQTDPREVAVVTAPRRGSADDRRDQYSAWMIESRRPGGMFEQLVKQFKGDVHQATEVFDRMGKALWPEFHGHITTQTVSQSNLSDATAAKYLAEAQNEVSGLSKQVLSDWQKIGQGISGQTAIMRQARTVVDMIDDYSRKGMNPEAWLALNLQSPDPKTRAAAEYIRLLTQAKGGINLASLSEVRVSQLEAYNKAQKEKASLMGKRDEMVARFGPQLEERGLVQGTGKPRAPQVPVEQPRRPQVEPGAPKVGAIPPAHQQTFADEAKRRGAKGPQVPKLPADKSTKQKVEAPRIGAQSARHTLTPQRGADYRPQKPKTGGEPSAITSPLRGVKWLIEQSRKQRQSVMPPSVKNAKKRNAKPGSYFDPGTGKSYPLSPQ